MAAAKKSRSLGNELSRFRLGLQALQNNSADFKFLQKDVQAFSKTIDALTEADAAQEKAKAAQLAASEQVEAHFASARTAYASLKRSWQAKYGIKGAKAAEFEPKTQGAVVKRKAKAAPAKA